MLDHSRDIDALVLSGTTEVSGLAAMLDSDEPADLSAFNAPFENRTGYEWLSRDESEVDAYVADEACGFAAPKLTGIATLARRRIPHAWPGSARTCRSCWSPARTTRWATGVRPSSRRRAVPRRWGSRRPGTLYPGARHELLNETNRDEVTADVVAFLDRTVGACATDYLQFTGERPDDSSPPDPDGPTP